MINLIKGKRKVLRLDHRYATKEELKEVNNELKKSEVYLNKLQDSVTEIRAGIGLAKWFFMAAIALVPIMTTLIEEVKDSVANQDRVIYVLPDGSTVPSEDRY